MKAIRGQAMGMGGCNAMQARLGSSRQVLNVLVVVRRGGSLLPGFPLRWLVCC